MCTMCGKVYDGGGCGGECDGSGDGSGDGGDVGGGGCYGQKKNY